MLPEDAVREAERGELRPVYVVVGEEAYLAARVLGALRAAIAKSGIAGFNEDKFVAGEHSVDAIVAASKMLPMMAKVRGVIVRSVERWEAKEDEDAPPAKATKGVAKARPLDVLADYSKKPAPSTVLVLLATKLNGSRKLMSDARKGGYLVECAAIPRRDLGAWVEKYARDKGHDVRFDVADLIAETCGPDLASIVDAVERLSLYVGENKPIDEEAVAEIVTRVRASTVWQLLDGLGAQKLGRALEVLPDVVDPRDGGLRLLGTIAWNVRQLLKFDAAMRGGCTAPEAAQRAGIAPFKVRDTQQIVKRVGSARLDRWIGLLAAADLDLKSSRRTAQAVLEALLVDMCR